MPVVKDATTTAGEVISIVPYDPSEQTPLSPFSPHDSLPSGAIDPLSFLSTKIRDKGDPAVQQSQDRGQGDHHAVKRGAELRRGTCFAFVFAKQLTRLQRESLHRNWCHTRHTNTLVVQLVMDSSSKINSIGLFFDEANHVRLLDPESRQATNKLLADCTGFQESSAAFQTLVHDLSKLIADVAVRVEEEKEKAIGSRNALKSLEKERTGKRQEIRATIQEKEQELQRLQVYHDSLKHRERELEDLIDNFTKSRA